VSAINPRGLHLAFLDPFKLAQLPFSIIEKMLKVQRMDMIIHVSLQDLQRNLDDIFVSVILHLIALRQAGGMLSTSGKLLRRFERRLWNTGLPQFDHLELIQRRAFR
jgi:hypothetical protein